MPIYYVGRSWMAASSYVATESPAKLAAYCAMEGYNLVQELSEYSAAYFEQPHRRQIVLWLDEAE